MAAIVAPQSPLQLHRASSMPNFPAKPKSILKPATPVGRDKIRRASSSSFAHFASEPLEKISNPRLSTAGSSSPSLASSSRSSGSPGSPSPERKVLSRRVSFGQQVAINPSNASPIGARTSLNDAHYGKDGAETVRRGSWLQPEDVDMDYAEDPNSGGGDKQQQVGNHGSSQHPSSPTAGCCALQ